MTPLRRLAENYVESLGFAYPIAFESGDPEFPLYCGGTSFAVRYQERHFIITAKHCLRDSYGTLCLLGPGHTRIPLKQSFDVLSEEYDNDWADVSVISTEEHWEIADGARVVDLDQLATRNLDVQIGCPLTVIGYPSSHTLIDPPRITRKAHLLLGLYGGETTDKSCHFFDVLSPTLSDPDGFSGSPVLKMEPHPGGGASAALVGMITRGGKDKQFLRFIGVDVVIRAVRKVRQYPGL